MPQLVLTSKSSAFAESKPTFAQFNTTSTSFVDVTNCTAAAFVANGNYWGFVAQISNGIGSPQTATARMVLDGSTFSSEAGVTIVGSEYKGGISSAKKTAGNGDVKLQLKSSVVSASNMGILANSCVFYAAPFRNLTDVFFTAVVTSIIMAETGDTAEGINAAISSKSDYGKTTIDYGAGVKMSQFIFSVNSGLLLWDFAGSYVSVTA